MEAVMKAANYIFVVGAVIAIIAGILTPNFRAVAENAHYIVALELLIGIVGGIFYLLGMGTLTPEETRDFLLAAMALGISGITLTGMGAFAGAGMLRVGLAAGPAALERFKLLMDALLILVSIGSYIAAMVSPTAFIVAIKKIWDLTKER